MGSWWHIKVGKTEVPVFGKSYVSDELMLLFNDTDRFVDESRRTEYESSLAPVDGESDVSLTDDAQTWHAGLMGYSATVGTLRARLELQGFAAGWVRELATALLNEELFAHSTGRRL